MDIPRVHIHDVLQIDGFSGLEKKNMRGRSPFELFKQAVSLFDEYKVEIKLLINANGIDKCPKWVEYINKRGNFDIQSHGWRHVDYTTLPDETVKEELRKAKRKIEETFGVRVTEYYSPRCRHNVATNRIAKELGMKEYSGFQSPRWLNGFWRISPRRAAKIGKVDFHFWLNKDVASIEPLLSHYKVINVDDYKNDTSPIFIIGAPRSGTTALLRYMADKLEDVAVFKEIEDIWRLTDEEVKKYYREKCEGKRILDKNVRNSLRIPRIKNLFPDAHFIHIIRNGRAVAASWRVHARKTKKTDQTIQGAAYQWLHYERYIWDNKELLLPRYKAIRYEVLCKQLKGFESRDFKWVSDLTLREKRIVSRIEEPFLVKYGYLPRRGNEQYY